MPYRNLVRGYLDGVEPGYCVLNMFFGDSSCTLEAHFFSAAVVVLVDTTEEMSLAQGGISAGAADGVRTLSGVQVLIKVPMEISLVAQAYETIEFTAGVCVVVAA